MTFNDLTQEQKDIVKAPIGNICCFAVAGSGKTSTLSFRVAHLLELGIPEEQILLITFSNKSAQEMSKRVNYLFPSANFKGYTFHSFGLYLCRKYHELLNLPEEFSILDGLNKFNMMNKCRKEISEKYNIKNLPKANVLLEIYSGAINHNLPFAEYISKYYKFKKKDIDKYIKEIFEFFVFSKQKANYLDFDDILLHAYDLLSDDYILAEVSDQFRHILVDEYQDINWIQYEILNFLNQHNSLFVIGDSEQNIFSWRGTNSKYIEDFMEEYPDALKFKLTTNFRSTQEILKFAEDSIANNNPKEPIKLIANNKSGLLPSIFSGSTPEELYKIICEDIMINYAEEFQNVAILMRYNSEIEDMKRFLSDYGIPAVTESDTKLTSKKYFKDLLGFIGFINEPTNENYQKVFFKLLGVSNKLMPEVLEYFSSINYDIEKFNFKSSKVLNTKVKKIYNDFFNNSLTISQEIELFVSTLYSDYIFKTFTNSEQVFEDIEHVRIQSTGFNNFTEFSDYYLLDEEDVGYIGPKVNILTIHRAKGLEWDYVYIPNVSNNHFPQTASETFNERRLFYVACTRAKEYLAIGFSEVAEDGSEAGPSIFLEEIDPDLYNWQG